MRLNEITERMLLYHEEYSNVSWSENHKYVSSSETIGLQMMTAEAPGIGVPNTGYKESSNDLWPVIEGLKGVSTVSSLIYDTGDGFIPATPILNATIDVSFD